MGTFGRGEFQTRIFHMIGPAAHSSLRFCQSQTNRIRNRMNLQQYVILGLTHSNYNHSVSY